MDEINELVSLGRKLGHSGERLANSVFSEPEQLQMLRNESLEREEKRGKDREREERLETREQKREELAHKERMKQLQ